MNPLPHPLILASGSSTRAELLRRLRLDFEVVVPDVDETPLRHESAEQTARRLSLQKAQAVARCHPDALVIGSDQVAECLTPQGSVRLGKPLQRDQAIAQLQLCCGQRVRFWTGLCVLSPSLPASSAPWLMVDQTCVRFRHLCDDEIARYVDTDDPLYCAGSFKVESLGISLFEEVRSDDPTALMGLPLIALCRALREAGWAFP